MRDAGQNTYLTVKTAVNKEAILTAYAAESETDETLKTIGVKVDQAERFYVTPKLEK